MVPIALNFLQISGALRTIISRRLRRWAPLLSDLFGPKSSRRSQEVEPAGPRTTRTRPNALPSISGTRKMVLRRMVPKDRSRKLMTFGVEMASCLRGTHQERLGASPQLFLTGFPEAGGHLDTNTLQNLSLSLGTIRRITILRVSDDWAMPGL